ncbi:hypothetical protein T4B_11751 [Trichinella pseudospiralis]|uniref:Uncharacterized protein n=1 Tax=Trichinella pseudospiralis TaxID=6337 RepID=A0A0V1ERG0_TRIPS|nr:hypothetical protein T4A_6078 [Trichinella pseudospiralis]KRZ07920.1 hypothetical protein T4B_11751 [Trichinella pseudospiralis]
MKEIAEESKNICYNGALLHFKHCEKLYQPSFLVNSLFNESYRNFVITIFKKGMRNMKMEY